MSKLSILSQLTKTRQSDFDLITIESLLNHLPNAAVIVSSSDTRIVCANVKACEITAYTRAELIDLPLDVLLMLSEGITINSLFDKKNALEFQSGLEVNLVHHNGSHISSYLAISRLGAGNNLYLLSFNKMEDLRRTSLATTRQEHAWASLNQILEAYTQPDLTTALNQILSAGTILVGASAICIYQADGQSPMMRQISVLDSESVLPEEIPPQDLGHLNQSSLWRNSKRPLASLHRKARAANLEFTASTPIGEHNAAIGLLVAAGSIPPPKPILEILQFLANLIYILIQSHTLVSQLKSDKYDLQRYQNACDVINDTIEDGLIFLTPALQVAYMNTAAENALGYTTPEVNNHDIKKVLICNENLESTFRFAQEDFRPGSHTGIRLYRRNGDSFLANLRIIPIETDLSLQRIVIIFHDLSQQEEYITRNQQLEQRAYLADITASFAHEVRNPINNISTGLQLLAVNLPKEDPNQMNISRLQNDCERLTDLVKSGLSFVRPVEYKIEAVDLGVVITNLMERWRNRLSRTQVKYNPQIDTNTPPVEGDPRALEQVFTNLIDNAIQAMESSGGILTVNVRPINEGERRSHVEVNIIDTGPGIPDEAREHIFEPFFTTKRSGTGLGLAIVKRIVTAHKGSIQVSSIPGGTMFQVRIPCH